MNSIEFALNSAFKKNFTHTETRLQKHYKPHLQNDESNHDRTVAGRGKKSQQNRKDVKNVAYVFKIFVRF